MVSSAWPTARHATPRILLFSMTLLTITRRDSSLRLRTGAVLAGGLLAMTACSFGGPPGPMAREQHTVERGEATRARVEVDMSAGDLTVQSGAAQLFDGEFEFNVPALKPAI